MTTPPPASDGNLGREVGTAALSQVLRDRLEACPTAALSSQMRKHGLDTVSIDGVRALREGSRFVGTARTLRYLPYRADVFADHGGAGNAQKRLFDAVGPGEVIVIEARGLAASGTLGDILALRAHARGAAGIVTDGGVRDVEAVAAAGIPVFAAGAHPAVLGRLHVPWEHDVAVACGGATVLPGDVVVGDADGVVVVPRQIVEQVVEEALAQEAHDAWIAARVAEGHALDGLFPMNAEWRERYERDITQGASDA